MNPYTYDEVKVELKKLFELKEIDGIPAGYIFPYKKHDAIVILKGVLKDLCDGSNFDNFKSKAKKEIEEANPKNVPGTAEHKNEYPTFYEVEEV